MAKVSELREMSDEHLLLLLKETKEHFFRLRHRVAQVVRLNVQVRQLFENHARARIQLERLLVVLNRLSQVFRFVAVCLSQLRVNAAHGEVVVRAGFVVGRFRSFGRGLSQHETTQGDDEQQRFGGTNHGPTLFSAARHPRRGSEIIFSLYNGV